MLYIDFLMTDISFYIHHSVLIKYFLSLKTKYKNSKSWVLLPTKEKSFGQGFGPKVKKLEL